MTVAEARDEYAAAAAAVSAGQAAHIEGWARDPIALCDAYHGNSLQADDASIDYDLAVSIESQQRLRDGIAWA